MMVVSVLQLGQHSAADGVRGYCGLCQRTLPPLEGHTHLQAVNHKPRSLPEVLWAPACPDRWYGAV